MLGPTWRCRNRNSIRGEIPKIWVARQRASLDFRRVTRNAVSQVLPRDDFSGLGPFVVVCQLDSQLAGVLALEGETLPEIALAATGHDDLGKIDPGLANQVGALVLAEDGDFDAVVVGRVVHNKAQLLVPVIVFVLISLGSS